MNNYIYSNEFFLSASQVVSHSITFIVRHCEFSDTALPLGPTGPHSSVRACVPGRGSRTSSWRKPCALSSGMARSDRGFRPPAHAASKSITRRSSMVTNLTHSFGGGSKTAKPSSLPGAVPVATCSFLRSLARIVRHLNAGLAAKRPTPCRCLTRRHE